MQGKQGCKDFSGMLTALASALDCSLKLSMWMRLRSLIDFGHFSVCDVHTVECMNRGCYQSKCFRCPEERSSAFFFLSFSPHSGLCFRPTFDTECQPDRTRSALEIPPASRHGNESPPSDGPSGSVGRHETKTRLISTGQSRNVL